MHACIDSPLSSSLFPLPLALGLAWQVYNYNTMEKAKAWEAHMDYIRYVEVHPSLPYVIRYSIYMYAYTVVYVMDVHVWVLCLLMCWCLCMYVMCGCFCMSVPLPALRHQVWD